MKTYSSLHELMAEDEAKALEQTRREIAAEDAAWKALPQSERDRISAEREAKFADIPDAEDEEACDECGEFPENCECDSDDETDD